MTLEYSLLGYLTYGPSTGYDLHKLYLKPVRPTLSHIYKTLLSLLKEGLVEYEVVHQDDLPDRKVYRITDSGKKQLDKWLNSRLHHPTRSQLIDQIRLGSRIDKKKLMLNLRAYRSEIRTLLKSHVTRGPVQLGEATSNSNQDKLYRILAYETVASMFKSEIELLDKILSKIRQLPDCPPGKPPKKAVR